MSSTAPSKRLYPTNRLPEGKSLSALAWPFLRSTVGAKFLVALTGLGLTLFVALHMYGNLQIFAGQEKINNYARFLKDLGPLLWVARIGLLTIFVLHIFLTLWLKKRSLEARPIRYVHEATIQASLASRTMVLSGLVILAFVLFHLAHFTFGWVHAANLHGQVVRVHDPKPGAEPVFARETSVNVLNLLDQHGHHDVYSMMIFGFRNPVVSILYLISQFLLLMHLSHGVASTFQTLGANSPRWQPTIRVFGWAVTLLVTVGNIAIVIGVWTGLASLPPILYVPPT
jgi:succinate dehydrogenase / fumarate reductase cytochrome b subunit